MIEEIFGNLLSFIVVNFKFDEIVAAVNGQHFGLAILTGIQFDGLVISNSSN